ncbi:hypothetical protein FXO38_04121 [Capsicum annuum]|nr:hypothetical protein FXO37_32752 [Capsicum annuum]KAF3676828.1 hypothetical protein FXO38_04121 [Capsicum annuum]
MFSKMSNSENHVIEQLSEELELDIMQVKIWFDNKRYQIQILIIFNMIDDLVEISNDHNDGSNDIDLELRLKCNNDPNGPDLKLRLR